MVEEKDNGSKQLLENILEEEEGHIDYFEEQQGQIEQMGLPYYLTTIK
jgi:bacterioferritin